MIYNLYLHPLRAYPGPFWARSCRFWYINYALRGELPFSVYHAHQKYGPVVRVGPDELSYADPESWKEIYGHRPDRGHIPKDPNFYLNTAAGDLSIIAAPSKRHGELRRLMSHGFSEKALRDQEPAIQHYVDLMIRRLRDLSVKGEPIDLVNWYNFFTFDIVGDLAFGESFNCLETSNYHPWIHIAFEIIIAGTMFRVTDYYPWAKKVLVKFVPESLKKGVKAHIALVKSKSLNRLHMKTDRIDFMSRMADPKNGVSEKEFIASSDTVLLGGSETTATLLSGVTYFLMKNPDALAKLTHEIRSKFTSEEEIDVASVNSLEYMLACLNEAFRLYPPVPGALPRRTIEPETLIGQYVPPQTTVAIYQLAINRLDANFSRPTEYIPERWLGDPRFENDSRNAVQPFSVGPRNCIGRNLAYSEMRLVIARLLFSFDLEATPMIEDWTNQKIWFLWDKKPLWLKLHARDVKLRPEVEALASVEASQKATAKVY
ncbi:cytochrome P450 [Lophium mytilinum]|uniref:Cytochrome P450 n=1 Tax=Lophium mytilinum TaxID=390894 RepID=A0A6A6R5J8_9PEZI|nr:cytochrome P450 [Lophium mytilinum]